MKVSTVMQALAILPSDLEVDFVFKNHTGEIHLDLENIHLDKKVTIRDVDYEGRPLDQEWVEESQQRCRMVFNS